MTSSRISKLIFSFAMAAGLASLAGCAGQGDVDRTQPDKIDKSIFVDANGAPKIYYYRQTFVNVPPTSAWSFEGTQTDMQKIRFEITPKFLVGYRANAGLLRALRQFTQGRGQTSFYRKVNKLEMRTYQYLVELFLAHRKEIKHRDPQMAVSFALMMLTSALIELIVVDHDMKNWQAVIPKDNQSLKRELLRSFLCYLGIDQKG